ncbi:potassium channel subfamily K member 17 isoform X1 [Dipodomys merriami]|uniref:potassium channel subfamily K member 17 isoform X1 n=1 Tax=Dipodomys merriami TaxID=94247 RepID=UPI003855C7AF
MCRLGARVGPPCRAPGCRLRGTGLLLLAYLAYLVLGSCVFWALEGRAIQDSSHSFQQDQWHLLQNYTCLDSPALDLLIRTTVPLSRNLTCPSLCCPLGGGWPLGPQSLRQGGGQKDIIRAYKVGAHLLGNTTSMGRWEFMGSFFFSVSTITTIGYGNLSPQTMAARLFCVFFALVGIPLNLVVLNRLGRLMQRGVHGCARRLGGRGQDPAQARWLAGAGALLSGLLLFLLLPPLLFSRMEGWSYLESFYFAFVTLSTVGFGDYVIGMDPSRRYPLWYKNVVSLWILFGMAWLALIIKLILSLLETPGGACPCFHHSPNGAPSSPSWRQGPERAPRPHCAQPGCYPEGSGGVTQRLEPSAQVACCGTDS